MAAYPAALVEIRRRVAIVKALGRTVRPTLTNAITVYGQLLLRKPRSSVCARLGSGYAVRTVPLDLSIARAASRLSRACWASCSSTALPSVEVLSGW